MATYTLQLQIDSKIVQQQSSDNLNIAKQGQQHTLFEASSPCFISLLV